MGEGSELGGLVDAAPVVPASVWINLAKVDPGSHPEREIFGP